MRWLLAPVLMLSLAIASAQTYVSTPDTSAQVSSSTTNDSLPDAPEGSCAPD